MILGREIWFIIEVMLNDFSQYYESLAPILIAAGELIMAQRMNYGRVIEKEKNEIVTAADLLAHKYVTEKLQEIFPQIPIYSEEEKEYKSDAPTRWILDPLDGTTPWVWGNSGFAISLALEENGEIVLGAIYDPVMKELFWAEKGQGAWRNGEKIMVAGEVAREKMLMVIDWGYKDEKRAEGLKYLQHFLLPEMFGSRIVPQWAPALGFCRLAEGRIHAIVCNDTWEEDHSAGALIVREAGGVVSNFYHHESFNHREYGVIVTNNPENHQAIVDHLKEVGIETKPSRGGRIFDQ